MSLLIQINSADQITLSSPTSLNSAVRETDPGIPKQLVALRYFLLIRCVLSHYNLMRSMLVLQRFNVSVYVTVKCAWPARWVSRGAQGHKRRDPSISGSY